MVEASDVFPLNFFWYLGQRDRSCVLTFSFLRHVVAFALTVILLTQYASVVLGRIASWIVNAFQKNTHLSIGVSSPTAVACIRVICAGAIHIAVLGGKVYAEDVYYITEAAAPPESTHIAVLRHLK